MKRFIVAMAASSFLTFLSGAYCAAQEAKTFRGEITDENLNCVLTPMKAPEDVKGKDECILYWTYWKGERYVLYDAVTKTTYQLNDQDRVIPFIGAKVLITGTENNKLIKVTAIKKVDENTTGTDVSGPRSAPLH